jgi:hypothetical protein
MVSKLPPTEKAAHLHELLWRHTFSEDIGLLESSVNLGEDNAAGVVGMTLEEVVFDPYVLGARGHLHGFGSRDGFIIILKHGGLDDGVRGAGKLHGSDDFRKEAPEGQEVSHGLAQSNVLGFRSAECNLGLELRAPLDRTTTERHNVSGAGFHAHGILITLKIPKSGKVRVDIAVELKAGTGLKGETVVLDALEVSTDVFDAFFMTSTRTMGKPRALVNGELYLRMGIRREVHEHPNDGRIVPLFLAMGSSGVSAKRRDEGRGTTGVAVRHASGLKDFLNESSLGQFEELGERIRGNTHSQKSKGSGCIAVLTSQAISEVLEVSDGLFDGL